MSGTRPPGRQRVRAVQRGGRWAPTPIPEGGRGRLVRCTETVRAWRPGPAFGMPTPPEPQPPARRGRRGSSARHIRPTKTVHRNSASDGAPLGQGTRGRCRTMNTPSTPRSTPATLCSNLPPCVVSLPPCVVSLPPCVVSLPLCVASLPPCVVARTSVLGLSGARAPNGVLPLRWRGGLVGAMLPCYHARYQPYHLVGT